MTKTSNVSETRLLLSRNLRKYREAAKISQEELADISGLHRTYVSSVERGERNISIDNIERLANALNLKPSILLESDR
ncbi:helix-turn-helix transcriptional regulator [Brasilonema sp. CT11]|nr:helix-turn-helix transcriptional regulator [Brasilonema sp. CT11]